MSENPPLDVPGASRRHVVLMGAAVTVAAGGLTACSSGSATPISAAGPGSAAAAPGGPANGAASAPAAGGDPTPAATRATTAPSGKKAAAATATKPVSKASAAVTPAKPTENFAKGALAKLSSVPVGGSLKVGNVVIGRPSSARVVGHSAICTHEGCPVGAGGRTLGCPCHGSAFDAFTGAVKQGPATAPLPGVALVIKGSYVHHA